MKSTKIFFLTLFTGFLMLYGSHAWYVGRTVYGDGVYYYSWLRSVWVDRDVNFSNEYSVLDGIQPLSKNGIPGNKYAIGPALIWAPVYIQLYPLFGRIGYELPYQLAAGFVSLFAAYIGLLILYKALVTQGNEQHARNAILILSLSTNYLFYGAIDTVNSHAVSFLFSAVLVALLLKRNHNPFVIGLLTGVLMLMRIEHALFLIPYFFIFAGTNFLPYLFGILIGFLPQFIAWHILYGSPFFMPYIRGGEGFQFTKPEIIGSLFSLDGGLIPRTPSIIAGIIGIFFLVRQKPKTYIPFAVLLIAHTYLIASWSTWWQGASYASRMSMSVLPVYAFGFYEIFRKFNSFLSQTVTHIIIAILAVTNVLSILQYLITH